MAKLTQDQLISQFIEKHGNKYDYSRVEYVNSTTKVEIICPNHGSFFQLHTNHRKGSGCPSCSGRSIIDTNVVVKQFRESHGDRYDYSKVEYRNSTTKVEIICEDHGSFFQIPPSHKNGNGCPLCSGTKKLTTKNIITQFKNIHGDKYDYSKVEYKNNSTKVEIVCSKHGSFFQSPANHKKGKNCSHCSGGVKIYKDEILVQFKKTHGDRYDYSRVDYINNNTDIEIICKKHGVFNQKPKHHKSGSGCPECSGIKKFGTKEIIAQFKKTHGDRYDYSKVDYKNTDSKVEIVCNLHGAFQQSSHSHKNGSHCPKCKGRNLSTEELIARFIKIHGKQYDYSKMEYLNSHSSVEIVCDLHGSFFQTPSNHKAGKGCPQCSSNILTTREIIERFKRLHGDKYDYSRVVYLNGKNKVEIICNKHGIFLQAPRHHAEGRGCPTCNVGWSNLKILEFLESIDHTFLRQMDSIELLTIINQGTLPDRLKELVFSSDVERSSSIRALKEKLLNEDYEQNEEQISIDSDEFSQASDVSEFESDQSEIEDIVSSKKGDNSTLINLSQSFDDLHALDNPLLESCDEEAIEFLIQYKLRRLWNKVLNKEIDIELLRKEKGEKHFNRIKATFFDEYDVVVKYKAPEGYSFKPPLLMQKLTVFRIKKHKRYGNWSGTGAGKTVSFIITSREIDSKLTIVIGLNSNISQLGEDILDVFPDSKIYFNSKVIQAPVGFEYHYYKKGVEFDKNESNYLILNYDKFQQGYSEALFQDLTDKNQIDFICIDEVHNVKQRTEEQESKRRATLKRLIGRASEKNENLHLLGMSATPVINNLREAKSLLEMITGKEYDDLLTNRTLNNALEAFKHLTLNGLRYKPNYDIVIHEKTGETDAVLRIDGTESLDKLLRIGNTNYLKAEQILLELKLPIISNLLRKGVVIYSYFTTGMVKVISEYARNLGYNVGTFTGRESNEEREKSKKAFINGELDILIGSKPIGTGVNGLQYICNRMIILSLPWTDSEYTQLKGRIYRQGSKFGEVEIVIPQVYIALDDLEWSWDLQRLNLIRNKKTLADAAVDGIIPSKKLPSPKTLFKKSQEALKEWKERLKQGDIRNIAREDIKFPLRPEITEILQRKLGDFSQLNQKWSISKSSNTHNRIKENPEEWFLYHQLYSEKRETWEEIPFKVIASWIKRKDFIVADLGCGQNLLKTEIPENKVLSFDHYAIDDAVTSCDINSIPLKDDSVDISVLCLALMGSNSKDYLREAFRITRPMGYLFISEPRKKWEGRVDDLTALLKEIGFGNIDIDKRENFIYWKCGKV